MLAYDPRGVLKTVAFVQYLDGQQLYQFAKRLQRLTVKAGEGANIRLCPLKCTY